MAFHIKYSPDAGYLEFLRPPQLASANTFISWLVDEQQYTQDAINNGTTAATAMKFNIGPIQELLDNNITNVAFYLVTLKQVKNNVTYLYSSVMALGINADDEPMVGSSDFAVVCGKPCPPDCPKWNEG